MGTIECAVGILGVLDFASLICVTHRKPPPRTCRLVTPEKAGHREVLVCTVCGVFKRPVPSGTFRSVPEGGFCVRTRVYLTRPHPCVLGLFVECITYSPGQAGWLLRHSFKNSYTHVRTA